MVRRSYPAKAALPALVAPSPYTARISSAHACRSRSAAVLEGPAGPTAVSALAAAVGELAAGGAPVSVRRTLDLGVAQQPVHGGVTDVVLDDGVVPVEDGDRLLLAVAARAPRRCRTCRSGPGCGPGCRRTTPGRRSVGGSAPGAPRRAVRRRARRRPWRAPRRGREAGGRRGPRRAQTRWRTPVVGKIVTDARQRGRASCDARLPNA